VRLKHAAHANNMYATGHGSLWRVDALNNEKTGRVSWFNFLLVVPLFTVLGCVLYAVSWALCAVPWLLLRMVRAVLSLVLKPRQTADREHSSLWPRLRSRFWSRTKDMPGITKGFRSEVVRKHPYHHAVVCTSVQVRSAYACMCSSVSNSATECAL
jgi:hypothetical protein